MRRSLRWFVVLVVVAAGFTLAPPADAATCTVPGSHATINAATADPACTTIKLGAGPFYENVTIPNAGTKIIGKGGSCDEKPQTIIDGSPAGVDATSTHVQANDVSLKGVVVRNGSVGVDVDGNGFTASGICVLGANGSDAHGINIDGNAATVKSSEFASLDGNGVRVNGPSTGATITGNTMRNLGSSCIEAFTGDVTVTENRLLTCDDQGVRTSGPANMTIEDNVMRSINNGIEHLGNGAITARRNHIEQAQDKGIRVSGNDQKTITKNTIVNARHRCLEITGDEGVFDVSNNDCQRTGGIEVNADIDPVVRNNRIDLAWENHGFQLRCNVECENAEFSGNYVGNNMRDHNGFEIEAGDPGGLIADNVSIDSGNSAFLLRVSGWEILNNQAIRAGKREGTNDRNGFRLDDADGNTLSGNIARDGRDDGFRLLNGSDGNILVENRSTGNAKDGFEVDDGIDNELDANVSKGNHAEGIENNATTTDLTNNLAKGNRWDCNFFDGTEGALIGNTCADGLDPQVLPPQGQVD